MNTNNYNLLVDKYYLKNKRNRYIHWLEVVKYKIHLIRKSHVLWIIWFDIIPTIDHSVKLVSWLIILHARIFY